MKILELCMSPALGGLELYVWRCALALTKKHNVVSVINAKGKLAARYLNHHDLKTHYLSYRHSYFPLFNANKLARLIDQQQIDVLHIHWGNDLALAALAKKFSTKKPAIVYTRQMRITRSKEDIYHRFLYAQINLILTITHALENEAKQFINGLSNRIKTLYCGVAAPTYILNLDEKIQKRTSFNFHADDFVIGLFGRLEDGKGQHLLLEAIAVAQKNNISVKALIVGHEMSNGYSNTLQQLAENLKIRQQIEFADFVSDPQPLMQICDCIVLTSYIETFGLVLPEAMRAGIAVIGSNAGGVPEIIDHEKTGLLFASRNVNSLYQQIYQLYANPALRNKIALAGKNKADILFNQDIHFAKLEQQLAEFTDMKNI